MRRRHSGVQCHVHHCVLCFCSVGVSTLWNTGTICPIVQTKITDSNSTYMEVILIMILFLYAYFYALPTHELLFLSKFIWTWIFGCLIYLFIWIGCGLQHVWFCDFHPAQDHSWGLRFPLNWAGDNDNDNDNDDDNDNDNDNDNLTVSGSPSKTIEAERRDTKVCQ